MITIYDLRKEKSAQLIQDIKTVFKEPIKMIAFDETSAQACMGCWDCWLKTPGQCIFQDEMSKNYTSYMTSEKVILLMETNQGFINHLAKAFLDRTIPHYHPYIELIQGECHHRARYETYPDMVFHFNTEGLSSTEEDIIERYLSRTAYHFKSKAYRFTQSHEPKLRSLDHVKPRHKEVLFSQATKNSKWIIYNGSPRKKDSNSEIILNHVTELLGNQVEVRDLKLQKQWPSWANGFKHEQQVLFFMPLYVHAMPSHVMHFIETLSPSEGDLAFFIQSGFPESSQSHYLEGYFEQLTMRLNRNYLGTAIKGGVEGLQSRPEKAKQRMIDQMSHTIKHLVEEGYYHPEHIRIMSIPVKFQGIVKIIVGILMKCGVTNKFWDKKLHKNNAYDDRFSQPFVK